MKKSVSAALALTVTCLTASVMILQSGCEISGGDDTIRQVSVNVQGTYANSSGIPDRQNGNRVTTLNIIQSGDQLTAVDNLGARWEGTIGRASNNVATVTLNGTTSNGVEVVITGSITVDGTTGRLQGLWVEPGLTAGVSATATVQAQPTATPGATSTPVPGATSTPGVSIPTATPLATNTPFFPSPTPTSTVALPPLPP